MSKEELLRIYSSYLPYGLNVRCDKETYLQPDDERIGELRCIDLEQNYEAVIYGEAGYYLCDLSDLKPVLWSMDMLTQPIEHKGETFVPSNWFGRFKINVNSPLDNPYTVVRKMIEWHFNVFNLPESAYIKKENLKK